MSFKGVESSKNNTLQSYKQYDKDSVIEFHKNNKSIETFKNIEHFGLFSDNTKTNINETAVKNLTENTKNITNEMVANAVTKIMTAAINEASQKSQTDIVKLVSLSNIISLSNITTGGDLVITNVDQSTITDSTTDATVVQDLRSKITNEFTTSINKKFSQSTSNIDSIKNNLKAGTNVGDVIGGAINAMYDIGGKFLDNAGEVLGNITSSTIGGSVEEKNITKTNISDTVKDTLNLKNPVSFDDVDDISEDIKNILSQENMAKCAEEVQQDSNINIADATVKGDVILDNISQTAVVKSTLKCAFNVTAMNEMTTKIVKNIKKIYEQIGENIKQEESEETVGDLYALGEAGKAILVGAGEGIGTAGKGLGEGIGTAAEGAGEGISTAAKGVGEGVATIGESLMIPLIIGAAVIGIGLVFYLIMRFGGGGGDDYDDYDDYDDDDE